MKKKPCEPVVLEFWEYGDVEAEINVEQVKPKPRNYYFGCRNGIRVPVKFSVWMSDAKLSRVQACGQCGSLATAIRRRRAKAVLLDDPQRVVTDADAQVLARAIESAVKVGGEFPTIRGASYGEKQIFKARKR